MSTSTAPLSYLDVATLLGVEEEALEEMFWQKACDLRMAIPCQVVSFDSSRQTVKVQVAILENLKLNGVPTPVAIPPMEDVPVCLPRGGGMTLTFPIKPGDQCLVVFADMCIDAWYQSGGVNNNQMKRRRHNLSDGMAIFGVWDQTRVLTAYSTTATQLRTDDGVTLIDVTPNLVTIKSVNIKLQGDVEVTGTLSVDGSASIANTLAVTNNFTCGTIHGRTFLLHSHTGVTTGGGTSGGVV